MYRLYDWYAVREKQSDTIIDALFVALLLLALSSGLWLLWHSQPAVWVDVFSDDAYYYFGIARNMVETGVSSFLPPFKTNGYQPLWLVVLSGAAYVFGTSIMSLLTQAYVISFLFVLAFFYASKKRYGIGFPAIISSFSASSIMVQGMETTMMPVFFVLFMTSLSWQARGVFGSLLFLTRLDALSVVIVRDVYCYVFKKQALDIRHYAVIVPVLLVYVAINYYCFGTPVPVSGLAKSVGNVLGENYHVSFGYIRALKNASPLLVLVLLFLMLKKKPLSELRFKDEIAVLLGVCVLCIGYYGAMSGWPIWPWYYWAPFLLSYYLLMEVVFMLKEMAKSSDGHLHNGLVVVLLLALLIVTKSALGFVKWMVTSVKQPPSVEGLDPSFGRKNLELADWVKQHNIPSNSMFAMGDRAGSFGFFLGNNFRFLHTEGLVGPTAYYKAMASDNANSFIDALDINYWVAEREKFIEAQDVIGVIEPVQGLSSHRGPYVVCFKKEGIVLDQSYVTPRYRSQKQYEYRYVFDMKSKVSCPSEITAKFAELKKQYGGVRAFSLPLEYQSRDAFSRLVNMPW